MAGASPTDNANISGALRPIDGVDVWPLLTGANETQPRPVEVNRQPSVVSVTSVASVTQPRPVEVNRLPSVVSVTSVTSA